ncbi:MAG: DUF4349 domain-containing protein [Ruminococcus sp.]|nr:DUF4349 domain-containing protein [Ruminococcus sp.]
MKKILISAAFAATVALTSCGDSMSTNSAADAYNKNEPAYEMQADNAAYNSDSSAAESYDAEESSDSSAASEDLEQNILKVVNKQMLVYSCDMNIDVLEFDESVDKFHDLIDKYKGFIESERYSDGGNSSKWQYSEDEKWKTLNAVIRVPSADYDNFCKEAEEIGDMRMKNASVQNLTTEYSDLTTTLKIYEAKEQRYLKLLAEIEDESRALSMERELTDIQVQIANIKTRMNSIENDVAYSYINLSLNEVREYQEVKVREPEDTFGQRFKITVKKTTNGFLNFLEGLLFVIISMLPYLILIGIAVFAIVKIRKSLTNKKKREYEERERKLNASRSESIAETHPEESAEEKKDDIL